MEQIEILGGVNVDNIFNWKKRISNDKNNARHGFCLSSTYQNKVLNKYFYDDTRVYKLK